MLTLRGGSSFGQVTPTTPQRRLSDDLDANK